MYGGDTPGLDTFDNNDDDLKVIIYSPDAGNIPEEYYSYLENWYRSQVSAHNMDIKVDHIHNISFFYIWSPFSGWIYSWTAHISQAPLHAAASDHS